MLIATNELTGKGSRRCRGPAVATRDLPGYRGPDPALTAGACTVSR